MRVTEPNSSLTSPPTITTFTVVYSSNQDEGTSTSARQIPVKDLGSPRQLGPNMRLEIPFGLISRWTRE